MRHILAPLLIGLLVLCPALCLGAGAEHDPATCAAGSGNGPCEGDRPRDRCPEDRSTCICSGAVQAADVRVHPPEGTGLGFLPTSNVPLVGCGLLIARHLTADGQPAGLAGWGDALTVRARLQNFRF